MKATEYKQQFVQLLRTAFPNGLPEGAENMTLTVNNVQFVFNFDPSDCLTADKPKLRRAKSFDDLMTEEGLKIIKAMHISIEDAQESKRK
jgi:hypothetical protein